MPISKIQNYLLYAFMFTGVFANYSSTYMLNNALMILFILSSFLTRSLKPNSHIFYLYAIIAFISVINQIYYYTIGEFDFVANYFTIPMIFLLLYAVNRIKLRFTFEDFIIANLFLLPVLFMLGGAGEQGGRIDTEYITANLKGVLIFFGFMVSSQNILKKKHLLASFLIFIFTSLFMVTSGSRQYLLFMMIGIFFLIYPILKKKKYFKSHNFIKKSMIGMILLIGSYFIVTISLANLSQRFGGADVSGMLDKTVGASQEYSSRERLSFIETAIEVSSIYPTGVGHGNTRSAISKYGSPLYKVTQNSHSLVAEILFATGYFGVVLWILLLWRLIKLTLNKQYWYLYGYIPIYFIVATFTTPLITLKVFWVSLVILERQIMKRNNRVSK